MKKTTIEDLKRFELIYLATPYSKYPGGLDIAHHDACRVAGKLIEQGVRVYSPIAHGHPIAMKCGLDPLDLKLWLPFDAAIMSKSDALLVAMMPTWEVSKGIFHETHFFTEANKPVLYLDVGNMELV